jgi:HK97 family phage prohead protease
MSEKEVKNIDLELKEETEGKVSAVFSVFNSLDSDGDVVLPGSIKSGFKSGSVPMVWAHKWDMPIGKGSIKSDGDKATFEGEFFMDTESGKEAYKIVKNMADMQQWSFGYRVNDAERGKVGEGDEEKDARFLKDLTVFEVSPVLVGANQDTYTMAIKSNEELLKEIVGTDEEKAVLGSSSFGKEPVSEELNEEDAVSPEVEVDKAKSVDEMPTAEELIKNPAKYLSELYKLKEAELQTQEQVSEDAPKAFSEQVKDVLAALNDLMVRATAIAMLRAKDGRKLGSKATEALRAVQEDLQDAWVEIDQFIDNAGTIEEAEVIVEEELTDEEPEDEITEEPVVEEVEVESDPEAELVSEEDNTDSDDNEGDELWLESQRLISESLDAELEVEDNI